MSFEKFNFDQSMEPENVTPDQGQSFETSTEKNHLHDLLWKIITDENVQIINDIAPEQLSELYRAAEIFSQPSNLRELVGGAEAVQVAKAEKLISQLLSDAERVKGKKLAD